MKNNTLVKKFEEITERIELLKMETGVETWKVIRTSQKNGLKEFTVYNLEMEVAKENDGTFIILSDIQDILMKEGFMFTSDQVKNVVCSKNNENHYIINIDFTTGENVIIESIPNVSIPDEIYDKAYAAL